MALEQLRAEIAMLVQQMDDEPEDIHELHARIRSKLNEIKAMGMPLPDDLVVLERRLDAEERRAVRAQAPQTQLPEGRTAKRPVKRAKRGAAKKAKRPAKVAKTAKKAARKSRGSKKSKRPAKKARGSSAKRSRRSSSRRR
jgi:hypothetical protein